MCAALYFCVCILCTAKHCVLSIIVQSICFTHFASPHNYYSVSYAFMFIRCVYLLCWCCLLFMFHLWAKLYDICLSQSDLFPWGCRYRFNILFSFPLHVYPEVELPDHMVGLLFFFGRSFLKFFERYPYSFPSGYTNLHSHQQSISIPLSLHAEVYIYTQWYIIQP